MYFSEEDIEKLKKSYAGVEDKYNSLLLSFTTHSFSNKQASEFALHGFTRRIKTLKRCIDNIYRICPPDIDHKPSSEELDDITINLQAYILNIYGALDNLAWVWVKEKNVLNDKEEPLGKYDIGLGFAKKYKYIRASFPGNLQEYLNTEEYKNWFSNIENFRHSLAHRIPLYVPPYVYSEKEAKKETELSNLRIEALGKQQLEEYERLSDEIETLGTFIPFMTHSFIEKSPQAVFHAEIIADWNTVIEISKLFIKELNIAD